jgi:hypothetical protein
VRRHAHVVGAAGDRCVDLLDVPQMLVLRVVAPRGQFRPLGRIVEVRQTRVVQLQIPAAELVQVRHLLGVRGRQVVPERLLVRVDRRVESGPAAPVVHHARRRDGELRDDVALHGVAQEHEVVAEDGLLQAYRGVHAQRRGREVEVALGVAEVHADLLVGPAYAAELVDEVHVPGRTPELPVGGRPQADVALHADDVPDRLVLDSAEFLGGDRSRRVIGAGAQQLGRAQQAADVVGPERRDVAQRHRSFASNRRPRPRGRTKVATVGGVRTVGGFRRMGGVRTGKPGSRRAT